MSRIRVQCRCKACLQRHTLQLLSVSDRPGFEKDRVRNSTEASYQNRQVLALVKRQHKQPKIGQVRRSELAGSGTIGQGFALHIGRILLSSTINRAISGFQSSLFPFPSSSAQGDEPHDRNEISAFRPAQFFSYEFPHARHHHYPKIPTPVYLHVLQQASFSREYGQEGKP